MRTKSTLKRNLKRRKIREKILQCIFAGDLGEMEVDKVIQTIGVIDEKNKEDKAFLEEMVQGVLNNIDTLDSKISPHLKDWQLDRIAEVDKNILRFAVYEILFFKKTPLRVCINEAVELAKKYGGEESYKFVNGILASLVEKEKIS